MACSPSPPKAEEKALVLDPPGQAEGIRYGPGVQGEQVVVFNIGQAPAALAGQPLHGIQESQRG